MFGFSFFKLIVLVAVIAAVWFGWRWFQRWELEQREQARRAEGSDPRRLAEDMVACRVCGTYVASKSARACGRTDCPYPR